MEAELTASAQLSHAEGTDASVIAAAEVHPGPL